MNALQINSMSGDIAHNLYTFYSALPDVVRREFLNELWRKQREELENVAFYLECKQTKDEDDFLSNNEKESFMKNLTKGITYGM